MSRYTLVQPEQARYSLRVPEPVDVQDPTFGDKAASVAASGAAGVSDPFLGIAQGIYKGAEALTSGFGYAPNPVSRWMGEGAHDVSTAYGQMNEGVQNLRDEAGFEGLDASRLAGNIASPVNALIGARMASMPASTLGRVGYGAAGGGASGAAMPVAEGQNYWGAKAAQTGTGAAGGAILTPAAGKAIDWIGKGLDKAAGRLGLGPKTSEAEFMSRLKFAMSKDDIDFNAIPEGIRKRVASEVRASLKAGKKLDGAALIRKLELDDFGGGTQGQITRDPAQWSKEFNLRQVDNAGEPLIAQVQTVRNQSADKLNRMGASGPHELHQGGAELQNVLRGVDAPKRAAVDAAFKGARNADGRYAPLDNSVFANRANDLLDEGQLGYFLPQEVRGILNGVSKGEIPLDVNSAAQMQTVLSGVARDLTRQGNKQGALAVGKVSEALNDAPLMSGEAAARKAFAEAKKVAAERFSLHRVVPALKDALDGKTSPDKFIDTFVIGRGNNASVKQVQDLAKILPENGKALVREQIAKRLEKAAFGQNLTKDGGFATDRYSKALDAIGKDKLKAFFDPDDVDELFKIARVNAYVNQQPAGTVPNRAGTAAALFNLIQKLPVVGMAAKAAAQVANQGSAYSAMNPSVPSQVAPILSPALQRLLPAAPVSAGAAVGSQF